MYEKFGISENLEELSTKAQKEVENIFKEIDKTCMQNSLKVLEAFKNAGVSE